MSARNTPNNNAAAAGANPKRSSRLAAKEEMRDARAAEAAAEEEEGPKRKRGRNVWPASKDSEDLSPKLPAKQRNSAPPTPSAPAAPPAAAAASPHRKSPAAAAAAARPSPAHAPASASPQQHSGAPPAHAAAAQSPQHAAPGRPPAAKAQAAHPASPHTPGPAAPRPHAPAPSPAAGAAAQHPRPAPAQHVKMEGQMPRPHTHTPGGAGGGAAAAAQSAAQAQQQRLKQEGQAGAGSLPQRPPVHGGAHASGASSSSGGGAARAAAAPPAAAAGGAAAGLVKAAAARESRGKGAGAVEVKGGVTEELRRGLARAVDTWIKARAALPGEDSGRFPSEIQRLVKLIAFEGSQRTQDGAAGTFVAEPGASDGRESVSREVTTTRFRLATPEIAAPFVFEATHHMFSGSVLGTERRIEDLLWKVEFELIGFFLLVFHTQTYEISEEIERRLLSEVASALGTHLTPSELGVLLMLAGNACRGPLAWNDVEEVCFWTANFSLPEFRGCAGT